MSEEMRHNPTAIFFTGTFTDARIEYLCKKYGIDKENVNEIATKEVRLFMERLRQTNREKKSSQFNTLSQSPTPIVTGKQIGRAHV